MHLITLITLITLSSRTEVDSVWKLGSSASLETTQIVTVPGKPQWGVTGVQKGVQSRASQNIAVTVWDHGP